MMPPNTRKVQIQCQHLGKLDKIIVYGTHSSENVSNIITGLADVCNKPLNFPAKDDQNLFDNVLKTPRCCE